MKVLIAHPAGRSRFFAGVQLVGKHIRHMTGRHLQTMCSMVVAYMHAADQAWAEWTASARYRTLGASWQRNHDTAHPLTQPA